MDYLEPYGVAVGKGKCHEEIVYRLVILSNRILDEISVYLGQYKLTPAKMKALMIVKHQGGEDGISQVDFSKRLMVSTSNLTRVLAKLLDSVWPGYV